MHQDVSVDYPAHWEADVVLADGGTVHLRPIGPDDADRLRTMHARLSPDTIYMRFFTMMRQLSDREVQRLTTVDHQRRVAFVALLRDELVGVVRFDRLGATADAEVAVVVEDSQQGRGLGPMLLEHLASAGEDRGVERFVANVLPTNRRMLAVFRSAGYELDRHLEEGLIELSYPIARTAASVSVSRAREHRADVRSVTRLLAPKSIAVIGASREPGTAGHEVFRALLDNGFTGAVYPVNPAAASILDVPAFASVGAITDDLDLAVIAVPAEQVLEVVRACVDKHVRGLLILSGGFGDAGAEGQARLAEVVRTVRSGGLRLIGPNAMGAVNTDPAISMHATFATGRATPGRVGFFSQSGALAGAVLQQAERRRLGLSTFVSIGDRADVSGNDLLQYWLEDTRTDVVALHLQGFGNPRKFARLARDVGQHKPVVALKSGRGAGDVAVDALFRTAGVIRVDTLSQLFETAQLLVTQPLPAGRRVGIVGTSSALAALAVDACRSAGLDVAALSESLRSQLVALTGTTEAHNPVDLGPLATAEHLQAALQLVAGSGEVDAVIVLVTPNASSALLGAPLLAVRGVPVLASFLGHDGVPPELALPDGAELAGAGSVPSYTSPEAAALALGRAATYAEWRARPVGTVRELDVAPVDLADLPADGTWVAEPSRVLKAYGLEPWPTARVATADEARKAAEELGWPVALKHPDDDYRNRVDMGAVRLAVGPDGLAQEWDLVQQLLGPTDLLVQPMAPPGVSTVVRLVQDLAVGPLISLRLGGVAADLLADPVVRTLPLTDLDARELVASIRGVQLLEGHDVAALEDLLQRVAAIGEGLPEVAEVRLDPVLVGRSGVTVLHAGVRLLPPELDPERLSRRLVGESAAHLR
jgi:acyl-CoA synthetase (NDP forming)/RimJ/RimL family protein N-acetyltransferase